MYIYNIYMCIYIYTYVYTYTYIYVGTVLILPGPSYSLIDNADQKINS